MPDNAKPIVSVVIPVYNKENCIARCIASLEKQTAPCGSFEIILIDDGSTDGSLKVCREIAVKQPFVRLIEQENQGVSGARNAGIKSAMGDYILFLDADDTISDNAIECISASFAKFGDDVDVVAYRMKYYYPASRTTSFHKRETWMSSTGIYALDEYPYLAQSTMNVCVRNRGESNILFNSSIKMGEDQLYITQNLERKKALGYCHEASYRYVRDGSNASTLGNNPLYAFDDMVALYEYLVHLAERDDLIARYAYQLVLYNFGWRIGSSLLFPTIPDQETKRLQDQQLERIVRAIPSSEIASSPYLSEYHKALLFNRYNLVGATSRIQYSDEATSLELADGTTWETVVPKIIFERCRLEGSSLYIRARFVCPSFLFEPKPTLSFTHDGETHDIELGDSSFDYAASRYKTGKAWSFEYEVAPLNSKELSIAVRAAVGNRSIPHIGIELKPTIHNARLGWNRIIFKGATLSSGGNSIKLTRALFGEYQRKIDLYHLRYRKHLKRRLGMRFIQARFLGKRIWLYVDLPTSPTEGNALVQLLHDIRFDDGILRFYVSNFEEELTARHPELHGRIVPCESRLHQVLSLRSELVLSSYLERFTHRPLRQPTYDHIADLATKQRRVYLQHGILHAHMPWYFSYDRILFDYVVISTEFERKNLLEHYHFPTEALLDAGAPRLDAIPERKADSKKIVFAPSWRNYLVAGKASHRTGIDSAFASSSFFQGMTRFLNLVSESGILEEHNMTLDIKLHPNFGCYRHLFEFNDPRIKLADDVIDESSYRLVITDFSSYVFDFVYAGADVMYFLPDYVEFEAGLNHYSKLDLPLQDGFGAYTRTPEEAAETLQAYLKGKPNKRPDADPRERASSFFLHHDGKNTERLYSQLKGIADSLQ